MTQTPSRVVLAYSGGLDTSVILKWLQQRGHEVVTFTADLGQGEELGPARAKAEMMGVRPEHIFVDDLQDEFVADFVMPMMRANAVYEGEYLLGTSIARPLISKRLVEIAREVGADAVAHGATGKGNDQVRFELSAYALAPDIKVIAPWREWDLTSRSKLIEFAEAHQIPIPRDKRGEAPFSTDANLLHTSSEGLVLEDPWEAVPDHVYSRTDDPATGPAAEFVTDRVPARRRGQRRRRGPGARRTADPAERAGPAARHRPAGPGGEPLCRHEVARALRDAGRHHLPRRPPGHRTDHAGPGCGAPEGRADAPLCGADLQRPVVLAGTRDAASRHRPLPGKGGGRGPPCCCTTAWRAWSAGDRPSTLYDAATVTFEDDAGAYDQADAAGFIKLNALRLRLLARRDRA